jgi:ligand-binding SRPBCC domain-containing protein
VKKDIKEVFLFFSDPGNLEYLTPSSLGFVMLTPSPVEMKAGALINYIIKLGFIPIRWTTLITACQPPYRFIDEQLDGPYSFWHHTHTFTGTEDGTLIEDEVRYLMPFGIWGRIFHFLFVRKKLEKIFDYRAKAIGQLFSPQEASKLINPERDKIS